MWPPPPSRQFHPFMADGAAGIGGSGNSLPVTAFPVLADEKLRILSIYRQHPFAAAGAPLICQIFMPEYPVILTDLPDQLRGVFPDIFHKYSALQLSPCHV